MSTLADLPDELMLKIFETLPKHLLCKTFPKFKPYLCKKEVLYNSIEDIKHLHTSYIDEAVKYMSANTLRTCIENRILFVDINTLIINNCHTLIPVIISTSCAPSLTAIKYAITCGYINVFRELFKNLYVRTLLLSDPYSSFILNDCVKHNKLSLLRYFHKQGMNLYDGLLTTSVYNKRYSISNYLIHIGKLYISFYCMVTVITYDDIRTMKLIDKYINVTNEYFNIALRLNAKKIIKYISINYTNIKIFNISSISILRYIHDLRIPYVAKNIITYAIYKPHIYSIDILAFLYNKGYIFTVEELNLSITTQQIDIIRFIHSTGCAFNTKSIDEALTTKNIKVINYIYHYIRFSPIQQLKRMYIITTRAIGI